MSITVNGEPRETAEGATIEDLLCAIGAGTGGIAVACNERVVQRSAYGVHRLAQGDRIEIIKAVAGG